MIRHAAEPRRRRSRFALLVAVGFLLMGAEPCQPPTPPPPVHLAAADVFINLGDSVAAGYNASPRDRLSYKKLLLANDNATWPTWAGRDLSTRFPGLRFYDYAQSGATSKNVLQSQLPNAKNVSASVGVLVVVHVGGNDLNDDFGAALLDQGRTFKANLVQIANQLRNNSRWAGLPVQVVIANFYEPTDDVGTIFGSGYEDQVDDSGTCNLVKNPVAGAFRGTYYAFIENARAAADETGATFVDVHDHFLGHAFWHLHPEKPFYDATDPTLWFAMDCTHAVNRGHHELRRLFWQAVTDEWFPG